MAFISITRLRVKSLLYLFKFIIANERSVKELKKTPGFIKGKELVDKNLTFWTLTMWENDTSMKAFRNSVPHRKAMQKLPVLCNEATYFHWDQAENSFPDWDFASGRLLSEGIASKVRNPSFRQITNSFPPIKWKKIERIFKS